MPSIYGFEDARDNTSPLLSYRAEYCLAEAGWRRRPRSPCSPDQAPQSDLFRRGESFSRSKAARFTRLIALSLQLSTPSGTRVMGTSDCTSVRSLLLALPAGDDCSR
jgi:hypothetical protein